MQQKLIIRVDQKTIVDPLMSQNAASTKLNLSLPPPLKVYMQNADHCDTQENAILMGNNISSFPLFVTFFFCLLLFYTLNKLKNGNIDSIDLSDHEPVQLVLTLT